MPCSKSPLVMLLGLMVMTAGFFLTMAGWFTPVSKGDAVTKVRMAGPICLGTGFALLLVSCLCCAIEQNNCECDNVKKDVINIESEDLPQTRPLIVQSDTKHHTVHVNQTHKQACNNSPARCCSTHDACNSLELVELDKMPLDRRKIAAMSSSNRTSTRPPASPVVHVNRHVRPKHYPPQGHRLVRPPSYREALHVHEFKDSNDPWEMQC